MGTPSYMAPEQALGKNREVGPPADIYALGAILYVMLTGRPPLQGTSWRETLLMVVDRDPVAPSRLQPKIPRDLETICLKCLAKEPARRYPSAGELAEDLGHFAAGRPIRARRTPAWERGWKWARRHPTAATLMALALAGLLGSIATAVRLDEASRLRAAREDRRLAEMRQRAGAELLKGQNELGRDDLTEARVVLTRLLATIRPEPRLEEIRRLASATLDEVQHKLESKAEGEADRARYLRFVRLTDEALLQDTMAAGLVQVGKPDRTRATAGAALDLLGGAGRPLPESTLTETERDQVASDRYMLHLVLAGAVARPQPGEDPARQAREAMAILDEASAMRAPTRAYRVRRADMLDQVGDQTGAARERAKAEGLEPSGAFDHFLLGYQRHRAGDLAAALRHFDRALQERPDLFWAQCLSAIDLLNSRPSRPAEAKAVLNACLQQKPAYAWLHLIRATAFGQMGSMALEAADRPAAHSEELRPEAEAHFSAAEADFRKALEMGLDDDFRYSLHMNRGVLRFQRGRVEEAVADFERAVALQPDRADSQASLAKALDRQGRHAEAIAGLDRAIGLEPGRPALYRDRALLRLAATGPGPEPDASGRALADLDEAIRREPPRSRAMAEDLARQAHLLLGLRRHGEALVAADSALAIAPDLVEAHRDRVAALLELRRFDEVIGSCDAAIARGQPSAELHELRGLARVGRGDFAAAVADYTQALTLRPSWTKVLVYRGLAYLMANAPELALADFEAVVRLDPSDPDGYSGRGSARSRLRQHKDAVLDAEESLRRGDPTPSRLYAAARTYAQALAVVGGEVARRGRPALREALAYESRSLALLSRAIEKTPADRRENFWREIIEADAVMAAIRRKARVDHPTTR